MGSRSGTPNPGSRAELASACCFFFTTFLSRFLGRFWRRAGDWRVLQASGPFLFYSGLGFTVAFRLLRVTQSAIGGCFWYTANSEAGLKTRGFDDKAHNCNL